MTDNQSNESSRSSEFLRQHTLINHYSIIEKLATGGMGDIYLAEDKKLNRKVVLKLITSKNSQNVKYKEMLTHEAKLSASLNHPNIVTIHEIIEYKNQPVVVMEYIEGKNLQDALKTKSFEIKEIVNIVLQISSALSEAHKLGIIHRDIKASNILINENNRVKILDFGLARFVDEVPLEILSSSSGTLYYMSPEQINNNEVTCQSDLFSLGVVFYQLLSGELPFKGDYEASIKYAIANEEPSSLGKFNKEIDENIEKVVNKLLEKDPQNRYQSPVQLTADLKVWMSLSGESDIANVRINNRIHFFILSAVVLVLIIYFVADRIYPPDNQSDITLAVLPFENLGAFEDEYFADGMTDALTMNLAQIEDIEVRSRNSSMLYKGSKLGSKTIGKELNVRYLLTGRIYWDRSAGNDVRIYSDLLDIEKDIYIWTDQYDLKIEKILEIQTKISKEIVNSLPIVLSEIENEKLDELPTAKIDAYIMFSRGQEYFNRSWDQNDMLFALEMFEKATEIDPEYSAAYAMVSRCNASLFWDHYDYSSEPCQKAKEYAEKSMSFDTKPVEGYIALGYYYYHCEQKFDKALEVFREGLGSFPNYADLYNALAAVQRRQSKLLESIDNFKHAMKLDPRYHLRIMDIALTYGMLRNQDSAQHYINRTIELAPDYSLAHIYNAWLPIIYEGNIESAKEKIQRGLLSADLKESKYYWWLLRMIDPLQELEYGYKKTPGTDSISYYLHMSQRNRLKNNRSLEMTYSDSALSILNIRIIESENNVRFNIALGLAYAGLRDKEKALYYGMKAVELAQINKEAMDAPFILLDFAEILLVFDEKDDAFNQLQFLLSIPGFVTPIYFETDPLWQPLFEDTAYSNRLLN